MTSLAVIPKPIKPNGCRPIMLFVPGSKPSPFGKKPRMRAYSPVTVVIVEPTVPSTAEDLAEPTAWPQEVMAGAAGRFARAYGEYLETPANFLYIAYLTVLGHVVCDKVTLASETDPQSRLFTVLLGESADTRKSTSIKKVLEFFQEVLPKEINFIRGVGSAEGLAKELGKNGRSVLVQDELKGLFQKMGIDGSTLLPCVTSLFEDNFYENNTKKHGFRITDAQLSLLAACTLDTFQTIFTPAFLDIGFLNRLFLVMGQGKRRFAIPPAMPEDIKADLRRDLEEIMAFIDTLSRQSRYAMPIDPIAQAGFNMWYFHQTTSPFSKRLDTYAHRLMSLLAVNRKEDHITVETMAHTIALVDYQFQVRSAISPIDAVNEQAKLEERIRRVLAKGKKTEGALAREAHRERVGTWLWSNAIQGLQRSGEIKHDPHTKTYRLLKSHQESHQNVKRSPKAKPCGL
jgi:hypothetical protein